MTSLSIETINSVAPARPVVMEPIVYYLIVAALYDATTTFDFLFLDAAAKILAIASPTA